MTFCFNLIARLLFLCLICSGVRAEPTAQCAESSRVHHVVVIWLVEAYRNPEDIQRLIDAHAVLRQIPGLVSLNTGKSLPSSRSIVDSSFDVASHFEFCSEEAMRAYLVHPVHLKFLETQTQGRIERIVVYDFALPTRDQL